MRRLVELPFRKSFQMAYQSIRVRFFRSLITTMSLVLAIAFVTYTQAGNIIAGKLLVSGESSFVQVLERAGYDISPDGSSSSPKQRWIVFLSLLVCVVGIINAQLMSVTERFREIGTLKCLGALDRFIVRIFLIEATLQGLAGGILGALLGAVVAILSTIIRFGFSSLPYMPLFSIATAMLIAIGVGTLLSLIGVLYPAIIASRMLPIEAMRVEQ